jgi:leader peptidase (prepilin peptidase)/N-methyltransferase
MSPPQLGAVAVLLLLAGYASYIDCRSMIIPDGVNLAIFGSGMAACFLVRSVAPVSAIAASVLGGGVMVAVECGFRAYRGYDGLGRGDVKFVAAAASWTGLEGLPVALLVGSLAALAYVLGRRSLDSEYDGRDRIPFGPFLAIGVVFVASSQIWSGRSWIDLLDHLFL